MGHHGPYESVVLVVTLSIGVLVLACRTDVLDHLRWEVDKKYL